MEQVGLLHIQGSIWAESGSALEKGNYSPVPWVKQQKPPVELPKEVAQIWAIWTLPQLNPHLPTGPSASHPHPSPYTSDAGTHWASRAQI